MKSLKDEKKHNPIVVVICFFGPFGGSGQLVIALEFGVGW